MDKPLIGIIMGSASDWDVVREAHKILDEFEIPHEYKVLSAHRAPAATNT